MFGISGTEMLVVLVVAVIVLDIPEILAIYKYIANTITNVKAFLLKTHESIYALAQEHKKSDTIIDLYGNPQITYSIEEVKNFLQNNETETEAKEAKKRI